jgi:predicted RNA binding protein YcfA (HicA-like mRNA interferase family)
MCIIHTMQSRELIKLLQADGWQLQRTRGSHHQFVHPTKPGTVTVPSEGDSKAGRSEVRF